MLFLFDRGFPSFKMISRWPSLMVCCVFLSLKVFPGTPCKIHVSDMAFSLSVCSVVMAMADGAGIEKKPFQSCGPSWTSISMPRSSRTRALAASSRIAFASTTATFLRTASSCGERETTDRLAGEWYSLVIIDRELF